MSDKFILTDIDNAGLCFAYRDDASTLELLHDVAECTDWDKLKKNIGGNCDPNYSPSVGSLGLVLDMQWTTGLEFADGHIGGGYLAEATWDGYTEEEAYARVSVEWNDSWVEEHGITGRDDVAHCMDLLVDVLRTGVETIIP